MGQWQCDSSREGVDHRIVTMDPEQFAGFSDTDSVQNSSYYLKLSSLVQDLEDEVQLFESLPGKLTL